MVEPAVKLTNISKSFTIEVEFDSHKRFFRKRENEQHLVFENINLECYPGDVIGILGRNGCGKSTLMKIMAEIIEPDTGEVEVHGKVASILELSMGFHNDLSGRDNIILRSELYGITRNKILEYVDRIVDYSDLGKFINAPVRSYSSGMRARLAFSIMINVDADIFLVDEALSTGDAFFSSKASEHLKTLVRQGKTVLLTSHNMRVIKTTCNRAIWLSNNGICMDGPVDDVIEAYNRSILSSFDDVYKLAKDGSSAAQYRLASFYRYGLHVESDYAQYRYWVEEAAIRGNSQAMMEYATILMEEDSIANRDKAMVFFKNSADVGNYDSRRHYSFLKGEAEEEIGYLRDIMEKISYSGYPTDICMYAKVVGMMSMDYEGKRKAFELFSLAAEKGNAEAYYRKGNILKTGMGTKKSIEEAIVAYEKASELGHHKAMVSLAELYYEGRLIEKDSEKAFKWFLASAISGNTRSQYQVAEMYARGDGVEMNEEESKKWHLLFVKSSMNDIFLYAADVMIRRGIGNMDDVVRLLKSASEGGYGKATIRLADMMFYGNDVEKDVEGALELYEASTYMALRNKTDYARALMRVDSSDGNAHLSKELYEQAAHNGDPYAMYALACMYRDGVGMPVDRELYKYYTHMASDAGNRDAMAVVAKWKFKEKRRKIREEALKSVDSDQTTL